MMDGAALSQQLLTVTAQRARCFCDRAGCQPSLAAVVVGEDPRPLTYLEMKARRAEQVGVNLRVVQLPVAASTAEVVAAVQALSADPSVDGIFVQYPMPGPVDERAVFEAVAPAKDVDGVTMRSFAAMAFGLPTLAPCTSLGIMRLLDAYGVDPAGRHAVVIGPSPLLGKSVGMFLLARDATVTYCHSHTWDLPAVVATADIVVTAVGKPSFVRGVGSNRGRWSLTPATTTTGTAAT